MPGKKSDAQPIHHPRLGAAGERAPARLLAPTSCDWTDENLATSLARTFRCAGTPFWPDAPLSVTQRSLPVLALPAPQWAIPFGAREKLRHKSTLVSILLARDGRPVRGDGSAGRPHYAILEETGEFIHAMPYRVGSYEERKPLMHTKSASRA